MQGQSLDTSGWASALTIQAPIRSTARAAVGEKFIELKTFVSQTVTECNGACGGLDRVKKQMKNGEVAGFRKDSQSTEIPENYLSN